LVQEETPAMFDGLQPPQIALWQIIHMATDLQILLGVVDHQFLYGALLGGISDAIKPFRNPLTLSAR